MKKKLVSVLLVACMALSLTACGGNDKKNNAADNTGTEKTDETNKADGTEEPDAGEEGSDAGNSALNTDTNILYINLASEPKYLDPALNSSVEIGRAHV